MGYREFLCGKALTTLTAYHWKLISIPCDTGNNTVQDVFASLGTYGDDSDFVMYEQSGDDNYETNDNYPNTDKQKLDANSTLELGKSYWIITNADHNVTINETLSGVSATGTVDANATYSIEDNDFTEVANYELPGGNMNEAGNVKKYMAGNPFPYAFELKNLYFSPDYQTDGTYKPMGDSNNNVFINPVVYKHDSPDTSDKNVSSGGGYEAVDASTPGFDNGGIKAMEGFFVILKESNASNSGFAYPLMMQNGSGN
jgi:hypothetical protein